MALVHFTNDPAKVPVGAVNVSDDSASWRSHYAGDNPDEFKVITYQTHVGLCLEEYEENGSYDSDFYMRVWNPETQDVDRILFYTTRGWMYPCQASFVDATPEVKAAYLALCQKQAEAARVKQVAVAAGLPAKGKTLEVIKGRKLAKGTQGVCMWSSAKAKYFYTSFMEYTGRVGIRTADGQVTFMDAANVRVVTGA